MYVTNVLDMLPFLRQIATQVSRLLQIFTWEVLMPSTDVQIIGQSNPSISASPPNLPNSIQDYAAYLAKNEGFFEVKEEISSSATKVIFVYDKPDYPSICFKIWKPYNDLLYSTDNLAKCADYLIEGLKFNSLHADGVYLGIAPIIEMDDQGKKKIWCGKLIEKPRRRDLKPKRQYALVMEKLEEKRRLDYQLHDDSLDLADGIAFLAKKVASMHNQLRKSPRTMGRPSNIEAKLALNRSRFEDALTSLDDKDTDREKYREIDIIMNDAYKRYKKYFQTRYKCHSIKRCHGDLKATNLWLYPSDSSGDESNYKLKALDCIDFKPEFCHIDVLSDIAMLAIDIEMRVEEWSNKSDHKLYNKKPVEHFLDTYLQEVQENKDLVSPLLEYYMTEKAMVCTFMSVLYDNQPLLGEQYLKTAYYHAQKLKKLFESSVESSNAQFFTLLQSVLPKLQKLTENWPVVSQLPFTAWQSSKKTIQDQDQASRPNK